MKVEVRLACGVLVGRLEVIDTIWDKEPPLYRVPLRTAFPSAIELTVGRWRDVVEGNTRRVFKVKLDEIQKLRTMNQFVEADDFKFHDEDDLRDREALAAI